MQKLDCKQSDPENPLTTGPQEMLIKFLIFYLDLDQIIDAPSQQ